MGRAQTAAAGHFRMSTPGTDESRRGITIVVPVYADEESVAACLTSLLHHVSHPEDRVLILNDSGPEADELEATILGLIAGRSTFTYHRNPANLGFVGNCNQVLTLDQTANDVLLLNSDTVMSRGVLDEISAVLHASPSHGFVSPRSNNATIATIPLWRRDGAGPLDLARSRDVFDRVHPLLPRFALAPLSMGFCFLVRREILEEHGLFDPAFSPGYGEENDLCLRMNAYGYASVIANHAFVAHLGARSFGPSRAALKARHERLLLKRHPRYPRMVRDYLEFHADPADVLADVLAPAADSIPHLVLDLSALDLEATARLADDLGRIDRLAASRRLVGTIACRRDQAPILTGLSNLKLTMSAPRVIVDLVAIFVGERRPPRVRGLGRVAPRWVVIGDAVREADWRQLAAQPGHHRATEALLSFADLILTSEPAAASAIRARGVIRGVDRVPLMATGSVADTLDRLVAAAADPVDVDLVRRRARYSADAGPGRTDTTLRGRLRGAFERLERRAPRIGNLVRRAIHRITRPRHPQPTRNPSHLS
jgi:GT2 family glycosyltransferase